MPKKTKQKNTIKSDFFQRKKLYSVKLFGSLHFTKMSDVGCKSCSHFSLSLSHFISLAVQQSSGCNWRVSYLSNSPCHGSLESNDTLLTHTLRSHDSCEDTLAQSLRKKWNLSKKGHFDGNDSCNHHIWLSSCLFLHYIAPSLFLTHVSCPSFAPILSLWSLLIQFIQTPSHIISLAMSNITAMKVGHITVD